MYYYYLAYGLSVRSELQLPELVAGCATNVDVVISVGNNGPHPDAQEGVSEHFLATPDEVCLILPGEASIRVRQGNEIVVEPIRGLDERSLRLSILGKSFAVLFHQRGDLVLHASAVRVAGQAVAFLGGSGVGKSTMAAALVRRGFRLVADDLLPIRCNELSTPRVFPGFPQLKLWPKAATLLGEDPETLPKLRPGLEKRGQRDLGAFPLDPLPLRGIYVLAEGEDVRLERLGSQPALIEMVRNTFTVALIEGSRASSRHFSQCTKLAAKVPVYRLERPFDGALLPDVVKLLEKHWNSEILNASYGD